MGGGGRGGDPFLSVCADLFFHAVTPPFCWSDLQVEQQAEFLMTVDDGYVGAPEAATTTLSFAHDSTVDNHSVPPLAMQRLSIFIRATSRMSMIRAQPVWEFTMKRTAHAFSMHMRRDCPPVRVLNAYARGRVFPPFNSL